jgi:hypothetical protein
MADNNPLLILETQYFPTIAWMQYFAKAGNVAIEQFDFYQKQSLRNRCHILGAEKTITLSVPLLGGRNQKTITKDLRIDNAQRWQQDHCKAIQSCYGKAPFYEYYVGEIMRLVSAQHVFLVDLNFAIIQQFASWLKWQGSLTTTESYVPQGLVPEHTNDQRDTTRTKKHNPPYTQVFFDRLPFHAGLSVVDALFCLGPGLESYLLHSNK